MHRLTESTVLKFHRHIQEREKKNKRNPNLIERKLVKVLMPKKKSAWTDLDKVSFKNFCQRVECRNLKIGVD